MKKETLLNDTTAPGAAKFPSEVMQTRWSATVERAGHLREQGWESWEDSMEMVYYINHLPWHSHKCRDVLKKTNQCNPPENCISHVFFTALVLVLIECNQKKWEPRAIYADRYAGISSQWFKNGKERKAQVWQQSRSVRSSSKPDATLVQKG